MELNCKYVHPVWSATKGSRNVAREGVKYVKIFFLKLYLHKTVIKPSHATYNLILLACADTAALQQGQEIHEMLEIHKVPIDLVLGTSLINMYAKSGNIDRANKVFEQHQYTKLI
jgi:hypothetical protein